MTLPNPGVSLSLSQIQTEFGGSNPARLNEYYANGVYVPAGTTGYYGAIPSSGTISIKDFYGATAPQTITITNGRYVSGLPDFYYFIGYSSLWASGPISPTTLKGVTIRQIYQDTTSTIPQPVFYIQVAAVVTQSFWASVTLTPGTTLYSSAATFTTQSTPTTWSTWAFNNYNPGWVYPGTSTAVFTF